MSENISNPINLFGLDTDFLKNDEEISNSGESADEEFDSLKIYNSFLDKFSKEDVEQPKENEEIKKREDSFDNNYFSGITEKIYQEPMQNTRPSSPVTSYTPNAPHYDSSNQGIENYKYNTNTNYSTDNHATHFSNDNNSDNNIDNIISDYSGLNKEVDNDNSYEDKIDDKKLVLLENIQFLRDILSQQDVNLTNVPIVTFESTINEIEFAYRILMIKNNRDINIDITNNIILGGIRVLEKFLNGERSFGGFKPNITGYSTTADITLRRLNLETEKIASEIMNKEINPYYKIAMALIPGLIAHSLTKQKRANDNLYKADNLEDALSEIKDI